MTEEYAVGDYSRRCMVIEHMIGDPTYYLSRLAEGVRYPIEKERTDDCPAEPHDHPGEGQMGFR